MLETLPRVNLTKDVHRFANLSHLALFANKKGLTIKEIIDVIAFDRGDVTKELIEGSFQRKQLFGNKFGQSRVFLTGIGRFSMQQSAEQRRRGRALTIMEGRLQAIRRRGARSTTL